MENEHIEIPIVDSQNCYGYWDKDLQVHVPTIVSVDTGTDRERNLVVAQLPDKDGDLEYLSWMVSDRMDRETGRDKFKTRIVQAVIDWMRDDPGNALCIYDFLDTFNSDFVDVCSALMYNADDAYRDRLTKDQNDAVPSVQSGNGHLANSLRR